MARINWTDELLDRAVDFKANQGLGWDAIATALGLGAENRDAVRIKVNRVLSEGYEAPEPGTYDDADAVLDFPEAPAPVEYEIQAKFIQNDYTFDGENYFFPVNNTVVRIPRKTWEEIIAAYSGEGANEVQARIAQDIGMHKKVLEACLRSYGAYKASAPVTREALAAVKSDADLEPLYEKAIEVREHQFIKGLQRKKLERLESENKRLLAQVANIDGVKTALRESVEDLLENFPRARAFPESLFRVEGKRVIAPVFDAHFGMGVQMGWGQTFNTATAAHYLRVYFGQLAAYATRNPEVSDVTVMLGGDLFHAFLKRTEAGTPLERDLPDRLVFREAFAAVRDGVEVLRATAVRVQILVIPGNHDHIFSELFEETLAAHYAGTEVDVPNDLGKRKYIIEGDAMHLFDHGEGFERLSHQQFGAAEIAARMTGGVDYHRVRKIYLYVGHTHHLEMKAHGAHLEILRAPNPAHTNDYEEKHNHAGEPQGIFVRLDKNGRQSSIERVYFADFPLASARKAA